MGTKLNLQISKRIIVDRLLSWHKTNYREYPFRRETDPYRILVSEIFLRQTRAAQVSRVYPIFIARYPKVSQLATTRNKSLYEIIKPLGIRSRVLDLLELAKQIEKEEHGAIPSSYAKIVKLPGVGRYIANSVLVRAYGKRLPLVDSNVNRVLSRVFQATNHMKNENAEDIFMDLTSYVSPVRLNYAVIDLAHSVCTYTNPRCPICPLSKLCLYAARVN